MEHIGLYFQALCLFIGIFSGIALINFWTGHVKSSVKNNFPMALICALAWTVFFVLMLIN